MISSPRAKYDILGKSTQELPAEMQRPVVHADDLVPL